MSKIAIAGTFDVENYGDCLFPIVAQWRMRKVGYEVFPLSPTGATTRWQDAPVPVAAADLFDPNTSCDGVIVGGGNIVHNHYDFLQQYVEADMGAFAYPSLWLGTTLACALRGLPIAWNAPGVPRQLTPQEQVGLLPAVAATTSYLSVRDVSSRKYLGDIAARRAAVVPDTAVELSRVWSKEDLKPVFRRLLERKGLTTTARFVAIHIKRRALQDGIEQTASMIDNLARRTGVTPILLALAPCHRDERTAAQLSAVLTQPHVVLDDSQELREIAAAIAWSEAYVGSSLHGYITSYSYSVPGIIVAQPRLPKFSGFMAHVSREAEDLVANWETAFDRAAARIESPPASRANCIDKQLQLELDTHWDCIARAMKGEGSHSAEPFLRYFVSEGLKRDGLNWAFAPLTNIPGPQSPPSFIRRVRSRLRRQSVVKAIYDRFYH